MEPGRRPDELSGGETEAGPQRSRAWWVLVAVVAAVWLAVARPDLSLHASDDRQVPSTASPTPDPRLVGITWSPRGDLVDDRTFVKAALARIRADRPELQRLFFAGRLPDGGRLVLAGSDVERGMVATAVHALMVPPDVSLERARVTEVSALTNDRDVLAWAARGAVGRVSAVVVARPGPARFELSPRVLFGPQGELRRRWTPVEAPDGAAVVDLGARTDPVVAVRAMGAGVFQVAQVVRVAGSAGDADHPLRIAGVPGPSYAGPAPELLGLGVRQAAGTLADLPASRLRVIWSGVPWKARHLALVLVTRPDGVRLQVLVGQQGPSQFPAGVRGLPKGTPDNVPWLLEPFSPEDPTFLLAPSGAGTLIYSRPGQPDRRLRIPESGAVVVVEPGGSPPSARGAEVTLLDRAGRVVVHTKLPTVGFDDPLALDSGFPTAAAR